MRDDDALMVTVPIPRSALVVVAPPPEMLSQKNVEAVAGIPSEAFLRALRRPDCPLHVVTDGKLRLVDRVSFMAWYKAARTRPKGSTVVPADDADAILLECGFTPVRRR